jgi:RHS repeat-associated protein
LTTGGGGSNGGYSTFTTPYFEQGNLVRAGEAVQPLGSNLMGDKVNNFSGSLEFDHTDVSLPGNNALPVSVGRRLITGSKQSSYNEGLFGDWDLEIPHLHSIVANSGWSIPNWFGFNVNTGTNLSRCSNFYIPQNSDATQSPSNHDFILNPSQWWDGYHLYVPGSGDQALQSRYPYPGYAPGSSPSAYINPIQPTNGANNAYPILTKEDWQFSCLSTMSYGSGEGFVGLAPNGTTYRFDHLVSRAYENYAPTGTNGALTVIMGRAEIWILPTIVTDRFGNWVQYSYDNSDPWKLTTITSSDGRVISLTYVAGTHEVQTVTDKTRTWTYGYTNGTLTSVTLPDNSQWTFALQNLEQDPRYITDPGCNGYPFTQMNAYSQYSGTVTHPSGATATFLTEMLWHGNTNVQGSTAGCASGSYVGPQGIVMYNNARYSLSLSMLQKQITGPGLPSGSAAETWTWNYSAPVGCFNTQTSCSSLTETVTVTGNDANNTTLTEVYGTQIAFDQGLLYSSSIASGSNPPLRTTTNTYAEPASSANPCWEAFPQVVGYQTAYGDAMESFYAPLNSRTISQQGATFTQTVSCFDGYARPTGMTRSSSLGYSKTEAVTYYDNPTSWVLGQLATKTVNGIQEDYTTYNSANSLPSSVYKYGKLQLTYQFNGDGTLYSATDGLNHTTTFSNYMRGLAQKVVFADSNTQSAVVNNLGLVTSWTNEVGSTWNYGYDAIGRLASETPPSGWNTKTLSFVQVPSAEYGLPAGHWRQTITQGNAVTVNYLDGRWRTLLTGTYDAGNVGGTQRWQEFSYDGENRQLFQSYLARSIASTTASVPGITTAYDALGRVQTLTANSELGSLTGSVAYLTGLQEQVTNLRGYVTTSSYQAYDDPDEAAVATIAAPGNVSVSITRDAFFKPLSITRSGPNAGSGPASVTRSYVYDGNQLLCKTVEPEIGATIQSLDAANNQSWSATGLSLTNTSSCDWASVPATSITSFGYDARNRLLSTTFGDGSPSITRSYWADGLPETVASNGSNWSYTYDPHRVLTLEILNFNQASYGIGRAYDANGHLSQLTYPDAYTVSYQPDALGEPTVVSGYANNLTYWPNGALAGYTLMNGVVHSTTQNTRLLPAQNTDAGVINDQYSYDANGNVTAITDLQQGINTRSMAYDGLDRLTAANAPNVWGNASYSYDALDNLRTAFVGSRSSWFNYDATNKISTINTNGTYTGYVYDTHGNITGRGTQGYYFDQGNRMTLANGVASYSYDGLGRRTGIAAANGGYATQVYSASGQLLYGVQQQGSNSSITRYVYIGGHEIAETNSAQGTTYVHTDMLGSPVAITNSGQMVISHTSYEPYGNTAAGTVPNGIGFTGHVNDASTGLVYMQQRYYDPLAGRFMSTDPVPTDANTGSAFNRFNYAQNNPYRFTDPDGRRSRGDWVPPYAFAPPPPPTQGDSDESSSSKETVLALNTDKPQPPARAAGAPIGPGSDRVDRDKLEKAAVIGAMIIGTVVAPDVAVPLEIEAVESEAVVITGSGIAAKEGGAIWSATKSKSAVENAFGHWSKHKGEFPELANSKQYVEAARSLAAKPPADALIKSRGADTLIYDKATNTFLVKGADGAPRTMFRPTDGINYWNKQ